MRREPSNGISSNPSWQVSFFISFVFSVYPLPSLFLFFLLLLFTPCLLSIHFLAAINNLIEPIRAHFHSTPELTQLMKDVHDIAAESAKQRAEAEAAKAAAAAAAPETH